MMRYSPRSSPSISRADAAAAVAFAVLAVAMTWPLAFAIDRAVAFSADPFINAWILDWDWYATLHSPLTLFHANAFYPARYSLAFSENLYGIALLLMPLRAVGVGALAAHNVAIIAGFAFSGFGAYLLGRTITGSALAGFAAGMFYAFVPFRFTQLSHVQHVWGGWLPMLIVTLLWYARAPSWRNAALFAAALLMNGLSNIHWLLFGTCAIALTIPIVIRGQRQVVRLCAASAMALVLLAPFIYPYRAAAKLYGMQRTWGEAMESSATLLDWLNPGVTNRFYRRFADVTTNPERWLFPGAFSMFLAVGGAVAARRERQGLAIALLWTAIGFIGSLGLHTFFHRFLFTYVPGFRAVRTPSRWASVAYVGMAMLIAFATAVLSRNRRWAGVVVSALLVVELRAAPIRWYCTSPDVPEVYRWLKTQPGPVIELPFGNTEDEPRYVLWSTEHHRKLANGASGFIPPEYWRLSQMWHSDPIDDQFVVELRRLGIGLIVLHGELAQERELRWLRSELHRGRISYVRRFNSRLAGDWVFALERGPATAPELEAFLRGDFTYSSATIGLLDSPLPGQRVLTPTLFTGWALSPYGVRKVDLLFDNGQVRIPTRLRAEKTLTDKMPWYRPTLRPRFIAYFDRRPPHVRPDTDVQVEITDGSGMKTILEGRWIEWP